MEIEYNVNVLPMRRKKKTNKYSESKLGEWRETTMRS